MATVTKPVALNESLNTTDSTPKNIADVLKDKLGDIASAISGGGGGSGGHTIQNASGANMPQESTMQFTDSHVSDDSTNEKTKVEVIKSVASADYSSETEDGLYLIPDGDGSVIEPASEDFVEVTADGVKTYAQLLNGLYALIDATKLTDNSYIHIFDGYFRLNDMSGGSYYFERTFSGSKLFSDTLQVSSSNSLIRSWETTTNGATYSESASTQVPTSGTIITLYYGTDKAVVDLQTTGSRCLLSDGTTVEQAMYVQSNGSEMIIEQSSWSTTTGDTTVTVQHTGYLVGTFNAHSCNGGGVYTHGVVVFIDSIPIANIYSQGTTTAEANSGSFCIPIKKGQTVIVRVNNGTWLGKAYVRY